MAGEQNIEAIVERIMVRNGMNTVYQRTTYASPFTDFVLQTELLRGWKLPKFTKFAGNV